MEKYFNILMKQFADSAGVKNIDIKSDDFIAEFISWVVAQQSVYKNYKDLLRDCNLWPTNLASTVEVGKGKYDSLLKKENSGILISPYADTITKKENLILLNSENMFLDNYQIINENEDDALRYMLWSNLIMNHNPLNEELINNFKIMHNKYNIPFILGVCGNSFDSDMISKRKQLENVVEGFEGKIIMNAYTKADQYFHYIASDDLTNSNVLSSRDYKKTRTR